MQAATLPPTLTHLPPSMRPGLVSRLGPTVGNRAVARLIHGGAPEPARGAPAPDGDPAGLLELQALRGDTAVSAPAGAYRAPHGSPNAAGGDGSRDVLRQAAPPTPRAQPTAGASKGPPAPGRKTWLQPLPTGGPVKLPPAPAFRELHSLMTGVPYVGSMPAATEEELAIVAEANPYFESTPLEPWEESSGEHLEKRNKLTQMFERKAYRLALYILEQSEEQASHEKYRYIEVPGAPANTETIQLREAAYELSKLQRELFDLANDSILMEVTRGEGRVSEPVPGMPSEDAGGTLDDYVDDPKKLYSSIDPATLPGNVRDEQYQKAKENFPRLSQTYKSVREIYGQRFPILLGRNQNYDYIANAAPDELQKYVGGEAQAVLNNIAKAREKLSSPSKIWSLPIIIEQTKQLLGIEEGTGANDAIQGKLDDIAWDELTHKVAMAGLQIGLQLVGAALSGGASLAVRVAGAGIAAAGTGVGVAEVAGDARDYQFKKAMAARVSLDAAKRLSTEEPGYGWLAFSIALTVFDVAGVVFTFRHVVKALKAADSLGDATRDAGALARAATAVGEPAAIAATKTATTLTDVENILWAQARVLKQEGKLADDLTEELFVARIMSGLRRQVASKGAIAEQQAGVLAKVIDGSHPNFQSLLHGDREALVRLLTEHGEWKSLVLGLERGGQQQIAKNLLAQRRAVIDELATELKTISKDKDALEVGPMKGGSEEPVSDIDLQLGGPESGEMLIQAEAIMARRFGSNWSQMFRLNFYTQGSRLTRYQEALDLLKPAQKAGLTKRMTQQAEALNFARMLQHAGDDAEAISRVEKMAQQMGVNLEELRPFAKMDDAARTARRNDLLREIDALEADYRTATGARRAELAEQISSRQMEANFYTHEANIGPGSIKLSGVAGLEKMEAYQGALTQLEMIEHILAQAGGDVALAAREYELWKYIGRFGDVAQKAGIDTPGLRYMRNQARAVADTQRELMEETAHLYQDAGSLRRPGITDMPQQVGGTPPVTNKFLESGFENFLREANEALTRLNSNAPKRPPPRTRSQTPTAPQKVATPPGPVDFLGDARVVNHSTAERYYVVDAANKRFYAEAHLEEGGELSLSIRTVDGGERSKVLRGEDMFLSGLAHFSGKVKSVRGAWNYGTNLGKFNELTAAGKSAEEAALGTWTGTQAAQAGFRNVTVRRLEGTAGSYTKVEVLFHP